MNAQIAKASGRAAAPDPDSPEVMAIHRYRELRKALVAGRKVSEEREICAAGA